MTDVCSMMISGEPEIVENSNGEEEQRFKDIGERAKINISGILYEVRWETLKGLPNTRLGTLALIITGDSEFSISMAEKYCDGFSKTTGEIFFERNPDAFPYIIGYYASKKLHIPRNSCAESFEEEASYWGIPYALEACCDTYLEDLECVNAMERVYNTGNTFVKELKVEEVATTKYAKIKGKIWNLFENPETSIAAKIVSVISNLIVILSTLILCVNTHPDLQVTKADGSKGDNPTLAIIEMICIIWFTIEYLIRLISSPNKKKFLTDFLNIIDVLAVLPYYIGVIIEKTSHKVNSNFINARRFIQILRIIRIVRVFKLARHSPGLKVIGYTLKESSEELGLLGLLLIMGVTVFASLVYYAEENVPGTKFKSILEACWWATISITTVGYGEMTPQTTIGKIIGIMCCVSGILFIALPIPTVVGNFSKYYSLHRKKKPLETNEQPPPSLLNNFDEDVGEKRKISYIYKKRSIRPINILVESCQEPEKEHQNNLKV